MQTISNDKIGINKKEGALQKCEVHPLFLLT